jgi:hypothetical protein
MRRLSRAFSRVGHRLRETGVHLDRLSQRTDLPRVAFSVGDDNDGFSSGLRGYAIAEELRNLGWRTIVIPKQLELLQRQRLMRRERPNIVVLQKSRHPLNRPRYYPDAICVFDIDDADFLDPQRRDSVVECMKGSAQVIAGSRNVADFARLHNDNVDIIWTGSRPFARPPAAKLDPPVVGWAVSNAGSYPKEMALLVSALTHVRSDNWQFWLFGANDAATGRALIDPLVARGIRVRALPFMNYQKFLNLVRMVSIGLAPLMSARSEFSAGKSFGKILGYLDCRAAIVASDSADHALFIRSGENGFLAATAEEFGSKIDLLLADGNLREQIALRAHGDYIEKLSIASVAQKLDGVLRSLIA